MDIDAMKKEAVERMKIMGFSDYIIREFEKGKLKCTFMDGSYFHLDDITIEGLTEDDGLVYYVFNNEGDDIYELSVGADQERWEEERNQIKGGKIDALHWRRSHRWDEPDDEYWDTMKYDFVGEYLILF